jgi:hypothetical protein
MLTALAASIGCGGRQTGVLDASVETDDAADLDGAVDTDSQADDGPYVCTPMPSCCPSGIVACDTVSVSPDKPAQTECACQP